MAVTVQDLADLCGGRVEGDGSLPIESAAPVDTAGPGRITFVANPKYQKYLSSGFLTLQRAVNDWAYNRTLSGVRQPTCRDPNPPSVITIPMATAAVSQNPFFASVGYLLGLALTMATLYPVSKLLKDVVEEKESRMREARLKGY